jgi:heme/copper-type cytochrome/quinol oxidase subunit 2
MDSRYARVRDQVAYIGGQPVPQSARGVYIAHLVFYIVLLLGNVSFWIIYLIQPGSSKQYDENINSLLSWIAALALLVLTAVGAILYMIALYRVTPEENAKGISNRPFNFGQPYSVNFFVHLTAFILFLALYIRADSVSTAATPVDVIDNYNARTFALLYLLGITFSVALQVAGVFGILYAYRSDTNTLDPATFSRPMRLSRK